MKQDKKVLGFSFGFRKTAIKYYGLVKGHPPKKKFLQTMQPEGG